MCRRFGFLHSRVLLYRQDELSKLERTLLKMDEEDKETYPLALQSRKTDEARDDVPEEYSRMTLINKIDDKLKEYGKLFRRQAKETQHELNFFRPHCRQSKVFCFSKKTVQSQL